MGMAMDKKLNGTCSSEDPNQIVTLDTKSNNHSPCP